ncbi:hypothetical protein BFQ07_16405 [Escherichia coli]|nr:hypothetical protein BFQ07_16405 [Escherichia coli]
MHLSPPSLHDFTPLSLGLLCAGSGSRGARDSLKVDSSFCRETYTVSVIPKSLKLKQSNGLLSVFMRCHLINRRKQFRLVYDAVVRQALCDAKER